MQVRRSALSSTVLGLALALTATAATAALEPGEWFDGLEAGVCFDDVFDADGNFDFSMAPPIVPCEGVHGDEVVAVVPIAGAYPGDAELAALAVELCAPEYEAFLGRPIGQAAVDEFTVWPNAEDWEAGTHAAYCIVYPSEPSAGTAASGTLRAPGTTLAAVGEVDGVRDIYLVDGVSGDIEMVGDDDHTEQLTAPAWSPDGGAIAFATHTGDDSGAIHIVDLADGFDRPLIDGPGLNDGPAFSPNGDTLTYMSTVDDPDFDLYAHDLASGETTRLTERPDRDTTAGWSPDGTRIAFRRRTNGVSDIWAMAADGADAVRLTDDGGNDYDPRWSPDGSQLLFTSDRAGNFDIWVMEADGSDPRQLTAHPADDEYPAWSPDGEFVAFHSDRHGGKSLWLMRPDGSEQSQLSGHAPLGYPAFRPGGSD